MLLIRQNSGNSLFLIFRLLNHFLLILPKKNQNINKIKPKERERYVKGDL